MSDFNGTPGGNQANGSQDASFVQPTMPASNEASKTLWMGEMEAWMDENFIKQIFQTVLGENVQVKVIRDRNSGNAGYCFVEFGTPEAAQKALGLNGTQVPNSHRSFKLNWASGGGLVDRRDDRGPEFSIFVGDLGPEVNEFVLVSLFQGRFASCKSAKIMTDAVTGQSRGYGFVRFSDETDQQRALVEMQGVFCGNRPMRISTATPKTRSHQYGAHGQAGGPQMVAPVPGGGHMAAGGPMGWGAPAPAAAYYPQQQAFNPMTPMNQFTDPNNTTVFVGGLSGYVTEDELRSFFQGFGEITYVKIPPGKGCGFVQFVHRHAAEMAINQMQGYPIGNSRVRLSWGRSQNNSGVGTPYRPAPPPPHYMGNPAGMGPGGMGGGMPPHGGAGGPYGPAFGGNPPQGPPGGMQVSRVPCKPAETLFLM
ncbi:RNA-binding domain-containing protein [Coniochaeta sp. PMI_546]|nr:RNA-binding domain-containing protein [Coniochaeta sp. PMI_546]